MCRFCFFLKDPWSKIYLNIPYFSIIWLWDVTLTEHYSDSAKGKLVHLKMSAIILDRSGTCTFLSNRIKMYATDWRFTGLKQRATLKFYVKCGSAWQGIVLVIHCVLVFSRAGLLPLFFFVFLPSVFFFVFVQAYQSPHLWEIILPSSGGTWIKHEQAHLNSLFQIYGCHPLRALIFFSPLLHLFLTFYLTD